MPIQYSSGKPSPRVIDPKPTAVANGRGIYRWSAFYAPLATYSGTAVAADSTLAGDTISLLLFTADIPVICRAHVYDNSTIQTNTQSVVNEVSLPALFVTDTSGGGGTVTVSNYGAVLKGYAGAGQVVAVSGFAATIYEDVTAPLGTTVTGGEVQPGTIDSVAIECIANGAVASGIVGPNFSGKASFGSVAAPTPVIILNANYTQAIKDNDNLIVSSAGLLYQVVGLYYIKP
jgi:hypothetical protein